MSDDKILTMAQGGVSTTQIAKDLGLPLHAVRAARSRLGVAAPRGRAPGSAQERLCVRPGARAIAWLDTRAEQYGQTRTEAAAEVLDGIAAGADLADLTMRELLKAVARVCRGLPVSDEAWTMTKSVLGPLHPAEQARQNHIPEDQVRPKG